jgi:CDP-glycerol glycerophosphotransferase
MPAGPSSRRPTVSVVVPIHDVEPYLEDCLRSVQAQTFTDLEVVCVDDGSTDASPRIAAGFCERDPRFRLVRQAQGGLAAARNTGVDHATGDFLAFLDSDDLVLPDAYERMVAAARRTGSDLVTTDVQRFTPRGTKRTPFLVPVFTHTRYGTHVSRDPELLRDQVVPNKLWRRSFWDRQGLRFTPGILYEDIRVSIPAHLAAAQVDVLAEPTYLWRIREGGDRSITQRRLELDNLLDRVGSVRHVSEHLAAQGQHELRRRFDELALTRDVWLYGRRFHLADQGFRDRFQAEARELLIACHPEARRALPSLQRLWWYLVEHGTTDELAEVAAWVDEAGGQLPVVKQRGRMLADLPLRSGRRPPVPTEVFEVDAELTLTTTIHALHLDEQALTIDASAHLAHLPMPTAAGRQLRVWLLDPTDGATLPCEVADVPRPEATVAAEPDLIDVTGAGFRATIPTGTLAGSWQRGGRRWQVHVEVVAGGGVTRSGRLRGPVAGATRRPRQLDEGKRRIGLRVDGGALDVVVRGRPAVLEAARPNADGFELTVHSSRRLVHLRLERSDHDPVVVPLGRDADGRFVGHVDGSMLAAPPQIPPGPAGIVERSWNLVAVDDQQRSARLLAGSDLEQAARPCADGRELAVDLTRYGYVRLVLGEPSLWLDAVTPSADGFVVRATHPAFGTASLGEQPVPSAWLERRGEGTARRRVPVTRAGHHVELLVPVDDALREPGTPLPPGSWELTAERRLDGITVAVPVRVRHPLIATLPVSAHGHAGRVAFDDLSWQRPVLRVEPDLSPSERGELHQRQLRGKARRVRGARRTVLFEAGGGDRYAGDPRAISEALSSASEVESVWVTTGERAGVPERIATVRHGSASWHELMASAGAIVTDGPLPAGFVPRRGQAVVLTTDAWPLDPVGITHRLAPIAGMVDDRSGRSGAIVQAFGRPRLDVVADGARSTARIAEVRSRLRVGDDPLVVVAPRAWPTSDLRSASQVVTLGVDPDRLRTAHDERAWLAVVRPTSAPAEVLSGDPRTLDATGVPDPLDVLLAADVVVTERDEVALDVAAIGVPVLRIVDVPRDWPVDGPAPATVGTWAEAVDHLTAATAGSSAWTATDELRERCLGEDDGQAAERVAAMLTELLGTGGPLQRLVERGRRGATT